MEENKSEDVTVYGICLNPGSAILEPPVHIATSLDKVDKWIKAQGGVSANYVVLEYKLDDGDYLDGWNSLDNR